MARVWSWVVAVVALALVGGGLFVSGTAHASAPPFAAVAHGPTTGTPVPGSYLTADPGTWSTPPQSEDYRWLRDGTPIAGATTQDYLVQVGDVGHQLAPQVTGHLGSETATFTGTPVTVRKLNASLDLRVHRVHPAPDKARLVWMAISYLHTERPWPTDGGLVTAYRKKDRHWKAIGTTVLSRGAAFVRLPWKRSPYHGTKVRVCYAGSDAVALSCSPAKRIRARG